MSAARQPEWNSKLDLLSLLIVFLVLFFFLELRWMPEILQRTPNRNH